MGGVNPTLQLAAALDRRGVTARVQYDRVRVWIENSDHMIIEPATKGRKPHEYGRYWWWEYGGNSGEHSRDDYEGAAEAVVKFLLADPALKDTRCVYRIANMGKSFQQETDALLERARRGKTD